MRQPRLCNRLKGVCGFESCGFQGEELPLRRSGVNDLTQVWLATPHLTGGFGGGLERGGWGILKCFGVVGDGALGIEDRPRLQSITRGRFCESEAATSSAATGSLRDGQSRQKGVNI